MASYALKIFSQVFFDIFYFPFWWYSTGLVKNINWIKNFIVQRERGLAFLVWVKNILTPMYGQRDIAGYLISIFMRIVQIILRGLVMMFWLLFVTIVFIFWFSLPLIVIYQIIYQLV